MAGRAKFKSVAARHAAFLRAYQLNRNATRAAIAAGYSKKTAHAQGHRLLKDAEIAATLAAADAAVAEKHGLTVDRIARAISLHVFGDRRKLFTDDGGLRPLSELDEDTAMLLEGIESEDVYEWIGSGKEREKELVGRLHKVKTPSRRGAIDQAMAYLGMHKTVNPSDIAGFSLTIVPYKEKRA